MPLRKLNRLRQYSDQPNSVSKPTDLTPEDTLRLFTLAVRSGLSICPTIADYSDGDWTNTKPSEHVIHQRVNYFVINSLEYLNR